jgi:hypothetical protein
MCTSGLQINDTNDNTEAGVGYPEGGSRVFQWGWNPVGGASSFDELLTPNYLVGIGVVAQVDVITT